MKIPFDEQTVRNLQDFASRENLSYQSFVLSSQKTKGHDRSYLNDIIFPEGRNGESILDIGCYLGFFCIEALQRGASAATGIEPDNESVRQAREIASIAKLPANYIHGDFEDWDFGLEKFDTVLCLNVLHHMFDAVGAIKKIKSLAKRRIIIEFATPSLRDLLYERLNPIAVVMNFFPAVVMGNPRRNTDIAARTFMFTSKAMKILFDMHSCAFEPVTITKSPFKGRLILEARRRDLGHVAFVAGPTSSGKSTLFKSILANTGQRIKFGLAETDWTAVHGHEITLPPGRSENVLVHYDMLRPYKRGIRIHARDPRCDLLEVAEKISTITILVSAETLRKQILAAANVSAPAKLGKRHRGIYQRLEDPVFLENWYRSWFSYLDQFSGKTVSDKILVRDNSGQESILSASQWQDAFKKLHGE